MGSDEVKNEPNSTELKHLGFLKEITVKCVVVLLNVYDLAKKNSGDLKTTAETTVVSTIRPVYEKIKDLPERVIVFADDKFDKYAPSLAKKLVAKFQPLINKTTLLANQALDKTKSLVGGIPLVGNMAQSVITKSTDLAKLLVQDRILQKGPNLAGESLDTAKSLVEGVPLVDNEAQSLSTTNLTDQVNEIVNPTDLLVNKNRPPEAVNSADENIQDSILQKGPNLAGESLDTAKSLVEGVPPVNNVAQSLSTTNPTDQVNEIVNPTDLLVNKNPPPEAVNSADENIQDNILQKGPNLAGESLDTAKSLVEGFPLVDIVAQSLSTTNPTDQVNEIVNPADLLVNKNPPSEAVNSADQNIVKEDQAVDTKSEEKSG